MDYREQNKKIVDSYDYLGNSASTQDCTGLIPSIPRDEAELKAYEEIYHYRPKAAPPKKQ